MDIVKLIFICTGCLFIFILLRQFNKDYAFYAECALSVGVTVFSISVLLPVFDYLRSLSEHSSSMGLFDIIFKSAAVCLLCEICCELCRDSGFSALSSRIEFAGKCTLFAFCLPLIKKVFDYAMSFIS